MFKKVAVAAILCALSFSGSAYAYDVQLKPFKDETFDYSREPIYALTALGVVSGYPDGTYHPNEALTREAFVKLLAAGAKVEAGKASGKRPADVAGNRWSASYVSVAYERGWIDGLIDPEGLFHPTRTITREEVAMVMGAYLLSFEGEETRQQWLSGEWRTEQETRAYRDKEAIGETRRPYVYYAIHSGVMTGEPDSFKPDEALNRKQAAAVIYRLIDRQLAGQAVDFTGFYAIQSYSAIDRIDGLSDVIFGWSRLDYAAAGSARLDTATAVYRIPSGYQEAVAAADNASAGKELMVFYDGADLADFLRDRPARQAFIDSLLTVLDDPAYGFNGVCIDFEGLKEEASAANYTDFLRELKDRLGTHTLSAAVPPTYYYKGYDMKEIGKLADTVILMAYDFTHHESRLPSAPLPLVNDAVRQALDQVPAEKLVLGISKQANQWITQNGATASPVSPAIADVEKRIAMSGVKQTRMLPYFLDLITFVDERGSHEIYYEDTQSIADKIWLAKFYDLKGVSLWYMGSYTSADWALIEREAAGR